MAGLLRRALRQLDPEAVLVGNVAAQLFTCVARDAAACVLSVQFKQCFADYAGALNCRQGTLGQRSLPFNCATAFLKSVPCPDHWRGDVDLLYLQPH